MARAGRPAVAFVTEKFQAQGVFVAQAEGMPDVPQLIVPHPIAGIGKAAMAGVADDICEQLVARLVEG